MPIWLTAATALAYAFVLEVGVAVGVAGHADYSSDASRERYNATHCSDSLGGNGCLNRLEYFNCVQRDDVVQNAALNLWATQQGIAGYIAAASTLVLFSGSVSTFSLAIELQENRSDARDLEQETLLLASLIPGVWTLNDLVAAGPVTTALGLLLNNTECCNLVFEARADGQVYVHGHASTKEAKVVEQASLCNGETILWLNSDCCVTDILGVVEESTVYEHLLEQQLSSQPVFNGMLQGGCNVQAADLFAVVQHIVANEDYTTSSEQWQLQKLKPKDASRNVSITWFVASDNSMKFKIWRDHDIPEGDITAGYPSTAASFAVCNNQCRSYSGCNSYSFTGKDKKCVLKNVTLEEDLDSLQPAPGTDFGVVGLAPQRYSDSRYLLYHMLPGSYCEDDLVAAASVNTMLGVVTGLYLPLYFSRDNLTGQLVIRAPTAVLEDDGSVSQGVRDRDREALEQYSSCRSTIYVTDDDWFPPAFTDFFDVVSIDMMWQYLANATQQYHDVVWQEGCWSPLPTFNHTHPDTNNEPYAPDTDQTSTEQTSSASPVEEASGGPNLAVIFEAIVIPGTVIIALIILTGLCVVLHKHRQRRNRDTNDQKEGSFSKHSDTLKIADNTGGSSICPSSQGDSLQEYLTSVPRDWILKNVKLVKQVGEGSFGTVHMGKWHNSLVAVKQLGDSMCMDTDQRNSQLLDMQKEVTLMAGLRHPNIVKFFGVLMADPPAVVMEYCCHGSLYHVLRKAQDDPRFLKQLGWRRRIGMALDAAKGMHFLHSRNVPILHRDLKSPNLLVNKSWTVKVADFGLSKLVGVQATQSLMAMNPTWVAPEVISGLDHRRSSTASDVYSFGIIMWELLTLREPFAGYTPSQTIFAVVQNKLRPDIPPVEDLPTSQTYHGVEDYITLMKCCWAQEPAERPTFKTIVEELRAIQRNAAAILQLRNL